MEESNGQDQPSDGAAARRQSFIRDQLAKAGEMGMVTDEIAGLVRAAGLATARQTVMEDLCAMRDVGLLRVDGHSQWCLIQKKDPAPDVVSALAAEVPDTVPDGWENAHGDDDRADEGTMVLAIPFVVCTSEGGPFDDEAFVAGVQVGEAMTTLRSLRALDAAESGRVWVDKRLRKQLDLVAMHYGYVAEVEEVDDPDCESMWVWFVQSDPV